MDELFTHQHRTHFFSLHIHNNDFRFVRWDRTAVVATDIVAASSSAPLLVEFFRRFNLMDPQARGHDTSAARATASEQDMLLRGVEQVNGEYGYLRGSAQTMVSKFSPYRIRVDSAKGINPQYYIVQGPCTRGDGLLGPSMRGYWAWSVTCAEMVFLKDAWGPVPGNTSEADTLCTLFVNPYMPQIFGTGPVLGDHHLPQRSVALYGDGDNKQLEHHRVVQELSINLDLKELCRPRQVVQAIRDTLLGTPTTSSLLLGSALPTRLQPSSMHSRIVVSPTPTSPRRILCTTPRLSEPFWSTGSMRFQSNMTSPSTTSRYVQFLRRVS